VTDVRVAVVGTGYLGRFHAQKYAHLEGARLVGVCDVVEAVGQRVAAETHSRYFADHRDLLGHVDAVVIAATTAAHFELARFFLEHGVHVFVEKPIAQTSQEAAVLTGLAEKKRLKLQVGHIERFNPAFLSARAGLDGIRFIECHRLAPFKDRGTDVDVVLDLMIHDLDVILALVESNPVSVSAVGIAVLTDSVDVANARIEFANGAIANVTASRASTKAQRKFRVWQDSRYVSIDFGDGVVRRVTSRRSDKADEAPLEEETWSLEKGDALRAEAEAFTAAIRNDTPCLVSGRDAEAALALAELITADIERRRSVGAASAAILKSRD
jgi:predicted dehydrogenase